MWVCKEKCPWKTEIQAHKTASKEYYPKSKKENKEYGWHVYILEDGNYTYTFPSVGTKTSVDLPRVWFSKSGKFMRLSSEHTHVDGNNQFSGKDVNAVTKQTKKITDDTILFLATPNDNLYRLDSSNAIKASKKSVGSGLKITSKYYDNEHLPDKYSEDLGGYQ